MRQPSVMTHQFSRVPSANIPRSSFDRSHGFKTTMDAGLLIPIFVDEALPGDSFNVHMTGFARMTTPLRPLMDNLYFNTFFFAVPNRLLWDDWERFNGAQDAPGDSTDYLLPQVRAPGSGWAAESLGDYFGLPTGINLIKTSALPFRAYNLIWNEWFRDQNLQQPALVPTGAGPDSYTYYDVRRRGKRHDYFTSALPWPQKGESVSIPLGTIAPVIPSGDGFPSFSSTGLAAPSNLWVNNLEGAVFWNDGGTGDATAQWYEPKLSADLSDATAATINQLRQAFAVQRLYERDARGGTRYTEIVRSHFGVISPDARLQRPEYLGGGQSPVMIHQVQNNNGDDISSNQPLGTLGAYGTAVMNGHGFTKAFTEHCTLIGLVCIRADLNYQQGLNRMHSRRARFDFYWPALSHIGEQAVLNKEIYMDGVDLDDPEAADEQVWGYQERFAEYRYKPSLITGKLRSQYAQSLDIWHLAQDFTTRPALNASFIQEDPPIDRVVAVPSEPAFIGDFYFRMRCARPMPVYGVPGMIDHF